MNNQAYTQFTKQIKAILREERVTHKDINFTANMHRQTILRK